MGDNAFERLLGERVLAVADGAMGTVLFELGLEPGGCPELLNVERPDLVAKAHAGYVEAGSDIILTNTFGGNRARLGLHRAGERVAELNTAAVAVARKEAERGERTVVVAGSIGPTGELLEPVGPLSTAAAVEIFAEQAEALAAAGADVLWIETISSWEELDAATSAAAGLGLPVVATLSFDTNGHTMMGISPSDFGRWWGATDRPPQAVGANCGVGPADVVLATGAIATAAPGAVVVAKGNCGIPLYKEGDLSYPTGPEAMADYAELAVRAGARIVGACCGSSFDHIAAIRARVDAGVAAGPAPARHEIENRLGRVSFREKTAPRRTRRRH